MQKIFFIWAVLFCWSKSFAQANDSSVMYTSQLNWGFFKGIPDNDTLAARIITWIHLETVKVNAWNGRIRFRAYAKMNPAGSWVKPGYKDSATLQHEQTHFNITELYARNLASALNSRKRSSQASSLVQESLSAWQSKKEAVQNQYDSETKGGNDRRAQQAWDQKIREALQSPGMLQ